MNVETGVSEIQVVLNGKQIMEENIEENYLGDVILTDGRNIQNIKSKGQVWFNRILTILEGIPFGQFYFEVAILLRSSLLVSSM